MYDMYPEWNPTQADRDQPVSPLVHPRPTTSAATVDNPLQEALDRRDNGGYRREEN
ncbi:MAG: hypothetical protein ACR2LE_05485 [Nocardioidaceae bacterium]